MTNSEAAPYQAVLFDWDGTVTQTLQTWLDIYLWSLHGWGLNPTPAQVINQLGTWKGVVNLGVKPDDLESFWQLMHTYSDQQLPKVQLYPQALPTLQALHEAGVATALVTTTRACNLQHVLPRFGLESLFDAVITGHDVQNRKPHPEPLQLALSKLGVAAENALMIGDTEKDLEAANAAGVPSWLFYPPDHSEFYDLDFLQSFKPKQVLASWEEIRNQLLPDSAQPIPSQSDLSA